MALGAVILLVVVIVYNFLHADRSGDRTSATAQTESLYREYADKQMKIFVEQAQKANEQQAQIQALNATYERHQQRYEELLTRWEHQADRFHQILAALEKAKR